MGVRIVEHLSYDQVHVGKVLLFARDVVWDHRDLKRMCLSLLSVNWGADQRENPQRRSPDAWASAFVPSNWPGLRIKLGNRVDLAWTLLSNAVFAIIYSFTITWLAVSYSQYLYHISMVIFFQRLNRVWLKLLWSKCLPLIWFLLSVTL